MSHQLMVRSLLVARLCGADRCKDKGFMFSQGDVRDNGWVLAPSPPGSRLP
jgi:hypothetical protein